LKNSSLRVKQDLSDKASNKFFQVFPINKTVNIISSTLPAKNQTQKSNLNSSETENSTFVQTASSVLNKINPFELSSTLPSDTISNQSPKSAPHTDSTLKRFLFTAASNLSFDKTDRFIPDNVTYEVPILEEQLQYNEKSFSYDQELNEGNFFKNFFFILSFLKKMILNFCIQIQKLA